MKTRHAAFRPVVASALALLLSACAQVPLQSSAARAPLAEADAAIQAMIDARQMPGGQLWIEQSGHSHHRAYGLRAEQPAPEPADEATLYDAASLTKVIVTATLVQRLREQGNLDIEAPLQRYLPDCGGPEKAGITLRHLLTHTAGLAEGLSNREPWQGQEAALRLACALPLKAAPGSEFRYSDAGFILLGVIIAQQAGLPLDRLAHAEIFQPLGMQDSAYLPLQRFPAARIAPTTVIEGRALRGEVHDPTARRMGGVAGHAGLFTTSTDLARFARMLLAGGRLPDGRAYLSAESLTLLSTPQSPSTLAAKRSLGWDIDTPYSRPRGTLYPKTGFGHTGFTGCVLWIDPASQSFYVLLANRVHPGRPTNTLPLYVQLGTLAAQAAGVQQQKTDADRIP
ncbi:MAG: hypothetical protein C0423_08105 [Methylibium sp.]|nr:hypothetical protein [Methylibium sp.]